MMRHFAQLFVIASLLSVLHAEPQQICPPSGQLDVNHQLTFGKIPPVLLAGTEIEVTLTPGLKPGQLTALCFDSVLLPLPTPDTALVKLTIPASPIQPQLRWPSGDHFVYAVVDKEVVKQGVLSVTTLSSVRALEMQRGDNTFLVQFLGDGFDKETQSNVVVRMDIGGGATVDQNVCWNDADCNAKNSKVRGKVMSDQEIVVSGIDPSDERRNQFQVCVSSRCSKFVGDPRTAYLWLIPAISLFASLLLALGVVILARFPILKGKPNLISALFLDNETNTYSLSKLQFYIWTFVAVFGYIVLVISRSWFQHFRGLPPVPSGLPGIVGIAAGTAVGSQVVTGMSGPKGAGEIDPSVSDFITTGGVVAAERVQFLVWTLVGAISFFAIILVADPRTMTDLPEVPWSLLSISGLSALGYLGGKLARGAGPIITEVNAKTSPDPTPAQAMGGATAAASGVKGDSSSASSPAIADMRNKVLKARGVIGQITTSQVLQPILDAATEACAAADKAISAAVSGQLEQAKTFLDAATASASQAVTAAQSLKPGSPDEDSAGKVVNAIQDMAREARAASESVAMTGTPTFGVLDIRGRTLSRDATFRISQNSDPAGDDLDIGFDLLQPDPNDANKAQKPRILELDPDAGDPTVGKRLLLVVNIADQKYAKLFTEKSNHTLTMTNPDSQKAMLKFSVPESQKTS